MAVRWQADDAPLLVVLGTSLPPSTKTKVVRVGTPLTKLSGSAMKYAHNGNRIFMAQWIFFFHSLWEALGLNNFFFLQFHSTIYNKYYNLRNNSLSKIILVAKYCYKIVSNEDPGVRTRSAGLLSLCLLNYVPCKRHLA